MDKKYLEAISRLPLKLYSVLTLVDQSLQPLISEVNLRINRPVSIVTSDKIYFLQNDGNVALTPTPLSVTCSPADIQECVKTITEYSLHSYHDSILNGFITVKGGHRVGIIGSMSYHNNAQLAVNDISSLNLRIARQITDCSLNVTTALFQKRLYSTLIVGAPSSGKTTLLRDIAYQLGKSYKVAIVDERGELAAVQAGIPQNDVGILTDVLDGYKKSDGIRLAIRSLSPKVIILDEIGSPADAVTIRESLNAGVNIIASVHSSSLDELYAKPHINPLLKDGFERLIFMDCTRVQAILTERGEPCIC